MALQSTGEAIQFVTRGSRLARSQISVGVAEPVERVPIGVPGEGQRREQVSNLLDLVHYLDAKSNATQQRLHGVEKLFENGLRSGVRKSLDGLHSGLRFVGNAVVVILGRIGRSPTY
jgi:hypothetical protein